MIIKISPSFDINNNGLESFLTNLRHHKKFIKRVHINLKSDKKINIEPQENISFEILLTNKEISFYYVIPNKKEDLFKNEFNICYNHSVSKPQITDHLKSFRIDKGLEYQLQNHYFMSLKVDKRGEFPLNSLLESSKLLRENEKVIIQYLLTLVSDNWNAEAEQSVSDFENGAMTQRINVDRKSILKTGAKVTYYACMEFIDLMSLALTNEEYEHESIDKLEFEKVFKKGLSNNTKEKFNYVGYDTSIRIGVNSTNRASFILNVFSKAYNNLKGDNSLIPYVTDLNSLKSNMKARKSRVKLNRDILCVKELSQLLQLPTKSYQEEYHIKNIPIQQKQLPKTLLNGDIRIGMTEYKGARKIAYWSNNYNVLSLPKVIIGSMGGGKSEYITNYAVECANKGDGAVIFDYIKDCELSKKIKNNIKDKSKIVELKFNDIKNNYLLAYNEIEYLDDMESRLVNANREAELVSYLVDTLTDETTQPLTSKMKRYLFSACMITFINQDTNINDVINVLQNYNVRKQFINRAIESKIFSKNSFEILDLENLDEKNKKGKVEGTRESKIEGIIDRLNVLTRNIYLRSMLTSKRLINFVDYFNEKKIVLIQLPQSIFYNNSVKDTLVTFLLSKIWLAKLIQGKQAKPPIVHCIIDEAHQVPTASKFLADKINEVRKFGLAMVFTIHYMKQFKKLLNGIKSSGVSYMLIAGTEKENINLLDEEIKPYTIETAMQLKPFHSLNCINVGNETVSFISKLPVPLK